MRVHIGLMLAMAAAGCAREIADAPVYALSECERTTLVDVVSGARIVGAEDLAYDARTERLFVSAYDRRAVERAVRERSFRVPEGGVYAVNVAALRAADGRLVPATPIVEPGSIAGGLRPHGIDFDERTNEVVFINRAYQKLDGRWRMSPRIERAGADGEAFVGGSRSASCAANDVAAAGGAYLATFDHGACGMSATVEDVFGLARSGVADADGQRLLSGVRFANGLARLDDDLFALAATRDQAVQIIRLEGRGAQSLASIQTPGGPDNLTVDANGAVVAAVHPSLLTLALDRRAGLGRAPSRVVRIDPESGAVKTLLDDPGARGIASATVAVDLGDLLIVGSVTDAGLLVCNMRSAQNG